MTESGWSSLRMAATLALAMPSLGVRISAPPGRPLVEVSWMTRPLPRGITRVVPCAFRRSVACAHERHTAGVSIALCGLPPGTDPTVEMLLAPGDRKLPPDIFQVKVDGGWRAVFASLLPPHCCVAELSEGWPELGYHADPVTGVTLVYGQRSDSEGPFAGARAEHLIEGRARLLVAELVHEVQASV